MQTASHMCAAQPLCPGSTASITYVIRAAINQRALAGNRLCCLSAHHTQLAPRCCCAAAQARLPHGVLCSAGWHECPKPEVRCKVARCICKVLPLQKFLAQVYLSSLPLLCSPSHPPLTVLQLTWEHQHATNAATKRSSLLAAAARQLRLDCIMMCCAVDLNLYLKLRCLRKSSTGCRSHVHFSPL
jgi:hypothetical protein